MATEVPKSAVVYLRELRAARGFTQEALAAAANIGKRTVERLERERPIALSSFERIITAVGASADEVNYLMTHPSATEDEAIELARARIEREPAFRRSRAPIGHAGREPSLVGIQTYVRVLREEQGITRKMLADELGIGIGALADWESSRSSTLPLPLLVRALAYLSGTIADLNRIGAATDDHEALGRKLAEERMAAASRPPAPTQLPRPMVEGVSADGKVLRRLAAVENLLHYVLTLLKRALPGDAEDIERVALRWFQAGVGDEERVGQS